MSILWCGLYAVARAIAEVPATAAVAAMLSRTGNRFDLAARAAGEGGDFLVLRLDDRLGGRVAVETTQLGTRHLAVRAARAVGVDNVEQHEFAAVAGFLVAAHGAASQLNQIQKRKRGASALPPLRASADQTSVRLPAASLPRSRTISYWTFWPSLRPGKPARSTAEMWTKTSLPPASG